VLASAYRLADFSLAYPLARGTAPALLAVWAMLWLGERPQPLGLAGLAVLVLGLLVVGGSGSTARTPAGIGVLAALGAALLISTYSAIDGAAVRRVPPAPYTAAVLALTALLMTPAMLWRYRADRLAAELRRDWRRVLLVGPMMLVSYGLVLFAFSAGSVAYAGAVREVSIVFAALAGWRWLGERLTPARLGGALLICAGILVIALAG
jgi:drug/metabolite transporter (DMT)-like permease